MVMLNRKFSAPRPKAAGKKIKPAGMAHTEVLLEISLAAYQTAHLAWGFSPRKHPTGPAARHSQWKEWIGDYDPNRFVLDEINLRLGLLRV